MVEIALLDITLIKPGLGALTALDTPNPSPSSPCPRLRHQDPRAPVSRGEYLSAQSHIPRSPRDVP